MLVGGLVVVFACGAIAGVLGALRYVATSEGMFGSLLRAWDVRCAYCKGRKVYAFETRADARRAALLQDRR
jgi:hypothetical protein